MRGPTRYRLWWIWAAVSAVAVTAGPARAFYWKGWPGSQARVTQSLTPSAEQPGNPPNPSAEPLPIPTVDNPKGPPGGPGEGPEPGPQPTPEPATGLAGLLGLAALGARRVWKKWQSR